MLGAKLGQLCGAREKECRYSSDSRLVFSGWAEKTSLAMRQAFRAGVRTVEACGGGRLSWPSADGPGSPAGGDLAGLVLASWANSRGAGRSLGVGRSARCALCLGFLHQVDEFLLGVDVKFGVDVLAVRADGALREQQLFLDERQVAAFC